MASIPLEMDDIFGEDDDVEDFSPSRLPDLEDELEPMRDLRNDDDKDEAGNAQEDTDNAELMAKLKSMKGASKHVARKPIPKLDATRLTGERGIPILPKVFKDVPLKGKNHEKEDLKIIMQTLEHWAHRLFPKMPFAEVLERAERLGSKKEVQNCVKRIRLDMPVLVTDHIQDEEDDNVRGTEQEDKEDSVQRNEQSFKENEIDDDEIEELLREQALPVESLSRPDEAASQTQVKTQTVPKNGITDEMKARIEQNKKLALERRVAKLAKPNQGDSSNTVVLCDQPSSVINSVSSRSIGDDKAEHLSLAVSKCDNVAVCKTLNNGDIPDVFEDEVPEDSRNEETHSDEPAADLQSDKLFTEDDDSQMLHIADDD